MRCFESRLAFSYLQLACVDRLDFSGFKIACKAWIKGGTWWNVEANALHTSQLQPSATSILSSSLIAHGPTVPGREPWLLYDAVSVFSWTFCVVWFIGLAACRERKNRMNYAVWTIFDCKEVSQMSSSRPDAPNLHRPSPTSPPESRHLPSRWRGCWLSDRTARKPAPAGVWKSQKSSCRTSTFTLQHHDNSFNTESEPMPVQPASYNMFFSANHGCTSV